MQNTIFKPLSKFCLQTTSKNSSPSESLMFMQNEYISVPQNIKSCESEVTSVVQGQKWRPNTVCCPAFGETRRDWNGLITGSPLYSAPTGKVPFQTNVFIEGNRHSPCLSLSSGFSSMSTHRISSSYGMQGRSPLLILWSLPLWPAWHVVSSSCSYENMWHVSCRRSHLCSAIPITLGQESFLLNGQKGGN